jgi:hypothetical protein
MQFDQQLSLKVLGYTFGSGGRSVGRLLGCWVVGREQVTMPEGGAATGTRVLGDVPVYERAHPVALLVGRGDKVSSKTCSL